MHRATCAIDRRCCKRAKIHLPPLTTAQLCSRISRLRRFRLSLCLEPITLHFSGCASLTSPCPLGALRRRYGSVSACSSTTSTSRRLFKGAADKPCATYIRLARQPAAAAHRAAVEVRNIYFQWLAAGACTGKWCGAALWAVLRVAKAARVGAAWPRGLQMMIWGQ